MPAETVNDKAPLRGASMRVTREEIIRYVQECLGCKREQAAQVLETIVSAIVKSLAEGEEVRLHRFGKFFLRPKRTTTRALQKRLGPRNACRNAMTVAFKGFGDLTRQLNVSLEEDLERVLSSKLFVERRSEQREAPPLDATATVRISGIPVCEFQLKSVSGGGGAFRVPDDARILRKIRAGQEIDIHIHKSPFQNGPVLQRCRIIHITRAQAPDLNGFCMLRVKILGEIPM